MERTGLVTFKGNGMTLEGPDIDVGQQAPDFTALDNSLQPVRFADLKGQPVIISSVPSLDTPVCEKQTQRFSQEAAKLGAKVVTISMDLPFAQKRFCGANGIDNLLMLSDYKDRDFAKAYGLYIKELGLLARAVFIIDAEGKIVYRELVPEIAQEPDFDKILEAAGKIL